MNIASHGHRAPCNTPRFSDCAAADAARRAIGKIAPAARIMAVKPKLVSRRRSPAPSRPPSPDQASARARTITQPSSRNASSRLTINPSTQPASFCRRPFIFSLTGWVRKPLYGDKHESNREIYSRPGAPDVGEPGICGIGPDPRPCRRHRHRRGPAGGHWVSGIEAPDQSVTFVRPVGTVPAAPTALPLNLSRGSIFAAAGILAALNAEAGQIISTLTFQSPAKAVTGPPRRSAPVWASKAGGWERRSTKNPKGTRPPA